MRLECGDTTRYHVVGCNHLGCSELFARLASPARRPVSLRRPAAHRRLDPPYWNAQLDSLDEYVTSLLRDTGHTSRERD
jgi:hypothetical protein